MKRYLQGYIIAFVLTLVAFGLSQWHISSGHEGPSHSLLLRSFAVLAVAQMFVQLYFFLHLGDKKQGWNRAVLWATMAVILILVAGSIWIMDNLNYNMHRDHPSSHDIVEDEGFSGHEE